MRIRMRLDQSGGPAKTLDVAADRIRLGRAAEVAVDLIVFPQVSGLHARIKSTARDFVLVHPSRNNKTLLPSAQLPSLGSTDAPSK